MPQAFSAVTDRSVPLTITSVANPLASHCRARMTPSAPDAHAAPTFIDGPCEPVLGHEHRRRRRRQQLQVVASPHVTAVLEVQVAPPLHLPERRAQDQPDPSTGVPAPSLGVGHRLPARPVHRPTEQGDRVLLVARRQAPSRRGRRTPRTRPAAPRTCPRAARSRGSPRPSRTRTPRRARRCQRLASRSWPRPPSGASERHRRRRTAGVPPAGPRAATRSSSRPLHLRSCTARAPESNVPS